MHSRVFGKTRFHFNGDFSGEVIIDMNDKETDKLINGVTVPLVDLDMFVAHSRVQKNRGRVNPPNNPERAAKRADALTKVKEQVIQLLKEEQQKLLGEETELHKKMYQVAINAVNGAR